MVMFAGCQTCESRVTRLTREIRLSYRLDHFEFRPKMNAPSERTSTKSTASGFLQGSFDDDGNDGGNDGNDGNDFFLRAALF